MISASIPLGYNKARKTVFPAVGGGAHHGSMRRDFETLREKSGSQGHENGVCGDHRPALLDDKKLLEALRHSKLYREYERTFTEATDLPLALRPVEYFGLPFHGKKNENPFCAFLADRKSCCTLCLDAQACLTRSPNESVHSLQCPYGLTETVVPVVLGQRIVGFLCTGQVFTRRARGEGLRSGQVRASLDAAGATTEALHLWKRTRFVEPMKYRATVHLLTFFAKQLSILSNQLFIEQKTHEPEVVIRARQFIAEHKGDRITLAAVAQASGASMFHFCKLFRASTGVKFTEYVARSRVEEARDLLHDPGMRMSEVAYQSGFQSLTAFHRAFQRILGQSPTEYRRRFQQSSPLRVR